MDDAPVRAVGPPSAAEPIAGGRMALLVPSKGLKVVRHRPKGSWDE